MTTVKFTSLQVNNALRLMVRHSKENPSHGVNCACKDQFLRMASNSLWNIFLKGRDRTERQMVLDNLSYLLKSVARNLQWRSNMEEASRYENERPL